VAWLPQATSRPFLLKGGLTVATSFPRNHLDMVSSLKLLVLLSVDGFDGLVLQEGIIFRFDEVFPFSQLSSNFIEFERLCNQGLLLLDRRLNA